jgi:hypothetical protein
MLEPPPGTRYAGVNFATKILFCEVNELFGHWWWVLQGLVVLFDLLNNFIVLFSPSAFHVSIAHSNMNCLSRRWLFVFRKHRIFNIFIVPTGFLHFCTLRDTIWTTNFRKFIESNLRGWHSILIARTLQCFFSGKPQIRFFVGEKYLIMHRKPSQDQWELYREKTQN